MINYSSLSYIGIPQIPKNYILDPLRAFILMSLKVLGSFRLCSSDFIGRTKEAALAYRLTISIFPYIIADTLKSLT